MDPVNLSSNWKRLQLRINSNNTSKASKTSLKREGSEVRHREAWPARNQKRVKKSSTKAERALRSNPHKALGNQHVDIKLASKPPSATADLAIWAEGNDIQPTDLVRAYGIYAKSAMVNELPQPSNINEGLSPTKLSAEVGKYIALDCEMVGVGGNLDIPHPSSNDERSVLARASLVNYNGIQVYDSYVKPKERVTNWRTHISGISPHHMSAARDLDTVQKDVAKLIHGRILVGHAVHHDLGVLFLSHPNHNIRDTAKHPTCPRQTPALRKLAKEILGLEIQAGQHSSVEDARVCMLLYRQHKNAFEAEHARRHPRLPSSRAATKLDSDDDIQGKENKNDDDGDRINQKKGKGKKRRKK